MDIKRWFERSFSFDLPAWMYPHVLERLRGTPARVEDLVGGVPPQVLTHRQGKAWSIQETIGHLLDLEPLWAGRVEDILNGKPRLRDADLTNRKTHEANHNIRPIGDILSAFRQEREQLLRRLDRLDGKAAEQTGIHPRLEQPMRLLDLLFFVAEHDDHHLAQITHLKRALSEK